MWKQAQARQDMDIEVVDLRDHPLPFFNEVASNLRVPNKDPEAIRWQQTIGEFDGYIFVVAEYNHSITGTLKNALDQVVQGMESQTFYRNRLRKRLCSARNRTPARHWRGAADGVDARRRAHWRQRLHEELSNGR